MQAYFEALNLRTAEARLTKRLLKGVSYFLAIAHLVLTAIYVEA